MKMLTVSLLVCAMMALTAADAVPEAENNVTVTLSDQDAVPAAENNVTETLSDQDAVPNARQLDWMILSDQDAVPKARQFGRVTKTLSDQDAVPNARQFGRVTKTLSDQDAVPNARQLDWMTLSDLDAPRRPVCRSTCPDGWIEYNNRCFTYASTPSSWAQAEKNCQGQGGNLASVHSYEEQSEIQSMILRAARGFPVTWLGGYDAAQEGFWFWSDGTPFGYSYWAAGQPDGSGNCLAMNFGDRKRYDDEPCYDEKPYVCAKKK